MDYQIVTDSTGRSYKEVNGTAYHVETPDNIIKILEHSRVNRHRLLFDYGDTKTGQSWGEVNDIRGHIGRSTGTVKIPLLIHNSRSIGGGAILDHCIVKIADSKGGNVVYKHPDYKPAKVD
jgi:hypothetical protein